VPHERLEFEEFYPQQGDVEGLHRAVIRMNRYNMRRVYNGTAVWIDDSDSPFSVDGENTRNVFCDTSSAAITVNLPNANIADPVEYNIINVGQPGIAQAYEITVQTPAGDDFHIHQGTATSDLVPFYNGAKVTYVTDGTDWWTTSRSPHRSFRQKGFNGNQAINTDISGLTGLHIPGANGLRFYRVWVHLAADEKVISADLHIGAAGNRTNTKYVRIPGGGYNFALIDSLNLDGWRTSVAPATGDKLGIATVSHAGSGNAVYYGIVTGNKETCFVYMEESDGEFDIRT
jgi:hypothetical protein